MKNFKVGLQLYSVREYMEADVEKTLEQVSKAGYEYVEFAGYFGYTSNQLKTLLDKYNLKCVSVHQGIESFVEKKIEDVNFLKALGVKYVVMPWMDTKKHKGGEQFQEAVKEITSAATFLAENGIELLYHNHEFEFNLYDNEFLMNWLLKSIPNNLLKSQVDTCWVNFAGYNPAEYLEGLKGSVPVIHVKDYACTNQKPATGSCNDINYRKANKIKTHEECGFEFRPLGEGVVNIVEILNAADKAGTEYIIVEHDAVPKGMTQMEMAIEGRRYLRDLGI